MKNVMALVCREVCPYSSTLPTARKHAARTARLYRLLHASTRLLHASYTPLHAFYASYAPPTRLLRATYTRRLPSPQRCFALLTLL